MEAPVEAELQRIVARSRERGTGVEDGEGRVDARIWRDAGSGAARHAVHDRSIRQRPWRDRIQVALLEQIVAVRTDVADRHQRFVENFALQVDVPLLLVRCVSRLIVDALALRRKRRGDRRERRRKHRRDHRQILAADRERRIQVVGRRVHARRDDVVEDAVAGANRRLVIRERIEYRAQPRVDVLQ